MLCSLLAVLLLQQPAQSQLVSNVFGSNMVIQRNKKAPLWGWTTQGAAVSVTFDGHTYKTAAGADGLWKQALPAQRESLVGRDILVKSASASVKLRNVVFGDVIFCSGQSNMEFTVNSAVNATSEIAAANNYPAIRVFSGPEQNIDTLNRPGVFNVTHNELLYTRLNWSVATNQSIGCVDGSCHGWDYFSAVCWFAIRDLHDMLGGMVPIGGMYNLLYIGLYIHTC
jgi:sialate O-acetylesterase